MRAVTDGRLELTHEVRRHLELCLDCRACETACPSGVQYGKLIEPFRVAMEQPARRRSAENRDDWFHRYILFGLFPYPDKLRQALDPGPHRASGWASTWLLINTGLWRLLAAAAGAAGRRCCRQLEKPLPPLPAFLPAKGRRRARVALFTGCVGDAMFRQTNWATARVLQENGCDVRRAARARSAAARFTFTPAASEPARELADTNVAAFDAGGVDAIIVNVAGCGSMLKDYGHHWHDDRPAEPASAFAAKVRDVQRVPRRARPHRAAGRDPRHRHLSRRLPPGPRPEDPRAAAAPADEDSRA